MNTAKGLMKQSLDDVGQMQHGLAAPSASVEGTWGPSRDYFPGEIADDRVADGVDEWRRCVAELELKK